jgi:hypothetical protein
MNGSPNPYHLKELDRAEFKLLLNEHFNSVRLLGQCYLEGSLIDPLKGDGSEDLETESNKRWVRYIEEPMRGRKRLSRPIYLIGVASNRPLLKRPADLLTTAPCRQPRSQAIRQTQNIEQAMAREIEQLRATLAAAEEQHRALTETVSDRDRAAKALRAEVEQRAESEAALRAELEVLRGAVAVSERASREHAAAAEAMQGEISWSRIQLAAAERGLRERTAAAEALQGEIATSRTQLAAAERDARERVAAAEVMQREITSLRGELAAARDVGRAALASLRTPSAPIFEAPRNAGWLTVVLRRLGLRSSYPMAVSPVIADG